MRSIQLVHNPGAGDKRYDRNTLLELLEKEGFDCRYFSTKRKGWKEFSSHTDLVAVAGGDGTVRKVVKEILKRKLLNKTNRLAKRDFPIFCFR